MEPFNFKIVTINIRSFRDKKKRFRILNWITENDIDIALLQETFVTDNIMQEITNDCKGYGNFYSNNSDSSHSRGVGIFISSKFPEYDVEGVNKCDHGRRLLLKIQLKLNKCKLSIASIYAPNTPSDRINFFKPTKTWLHQHSVDDSDKIIGGDFNCSADKAENKQKPTDKSINTFENLKETNNLVDIYKYKNETENENTYTHPSIPSRNSRIDYLLVSTSLAQMCISSKVQVCPAPDHKAVFASFDFSKRSRGKSYWKLNNLLLQEESYRENIYTLIDETVASYKNRVSNQHFWELLKIRIKETSIKFSVNRSLLKKSRVKSLENELNLLDAKIKQDCQNKENILKRNKLKTDLDIVYQENTYAAYVRSRATYIEEGEKCSSFFLGLEKSKQSSNVIDKLTSSDGKVLETDEDILEECSCYYKSLYSSNSPDKEEIKDYLSKTNFQNVLSNEESYKCENEVTLIECENSVKKLKLNKSPGLDGLTAEFYQTFWNSIGSCLVDSYNESYQNGSLCESQNISILSLIHKKSDSMNLKNYRPISITNLDYKILALVLANRMQEVIDKIISTDQTGYIKKRFIGTNIRKTVDIIDYLEKNQKGGLLVLLDFQKAFDSVEWEFMFQSLEKFNFGPKFIQWIKLLYKNPKACVKNNGWLSDEFSLSRGIRQGCPVSALVFILVVEVMALNLKNNSELKGINTKYDKLNIKNLISQFADDSTLYLKDENQLVLAFDIINEFGRYSGPVINVSKTIGLWLGIDKHKQQNCNIYGILWPTTPINYLGVHIAGDQLSRDTKNWYSKLEKMEKLLNQWKRRKITIFGKISVIKALALPKITYVAQCLPVPDDVVKRVNTLFYDFIWGKFERVKRNTMIGDLNNGGLKMIDVESHFVALKSSWVAKILNSDADWAQCGQYFFQLFGKSFYILRCNFNQLRQMPQLKIIPQFYRDVIVAFNKSKNDSLPDTPELVMSQNIWGNRNLTYYCKIQKCNKSIYFQHWLKYKIYCLQDLPFKNGLLNERILYPKITDKRNIYSEVSILKNVLKPFRDFIRQIENNTQIQHTLPPLRDKYCIASLPIQSSLYYKELVHQKFESPSQIKKWLHVDENIESVLYNIHSVKIVQTLKDKKIAEFNFKVLNNILPCGDNLEKWKILQNSSICPICFKLHNISHLLFYCKKASDIWLKIGNIFNLDISLNMIVTGQNCSPEFSFCLSLIAFGIYKEWLLNKDNLDKWLTNNHVLTLKNFLHNKKMIYKHYHLKKNKWVAILNLMEAILLA